MDTMDTFVVCMFLKLGMKIFSMDIIQNFRLDMAATERSCIIQFNTLIYRDE